MVNLEPGGTKNQKFVRRIKPLCEIPERETAFYAYLQCFELQSIPCPYAGEAMRSDIRVFLNRVEATRPGTLFTTYNTALKIIPAGKTADVMKTCKICGEPSTAETCRVCQLIKNIKL